MRDAVWQLLRRGSLTALLFIASRVLPPPLPNLVTGDEDAPPDAGLAWLLVFRRYVEVRPEFGRERRSTPLAGHDAHSPVFTSRARTGDGG
jgi:hypothetical protein